MPPRGARTGSPSGRERWRDRFCLIGIRDQWIARLKWLDRNIRVVRAIRVAEAAWTLAAWEGGA